MASRRLAHRLWTFSKCAPGARAQAASAALKNVDAALGAEFAEGGPHMKFKKPRNMSTAVQEAEDSACGMRSGRDGKMRRREMYSPFGQLDMFDSVFPNRSLRSMIENMERIFEEPFFAHSGHRMQGLGGGRAAFRYRAPWDFSETKEAFRVRLDLPGLTKEEVKVFVEDGYLVIKNEGLQEKAAQEAEEAIRQSSQFHTKIALPENVNPEAVKAELKNGVLSVEIPKLPEIEPKKIDVHIE